MVANINIKFLFLLIILSSSKYIFAQNEQKPVLFCGVGPAPISEFQLEYNRNREQFTSLRTNNELIILPLTIHIIGQADGSGYYALQDLMITLCELNRNFAPHNLQFYIKDNIRYHNNNTWYTHATQQIGNAMAAATAVPQTINIWIANGAGGAAGYASLGGNRIWLAKNSIRGVGNTTLTHEMGHSLNLLHTFNGWEPRTYQQGTVAPAFVTHAGQNIPVERVDRSNCDTAGDGFCDTGSDFLSFRWNCNADEESPIIQTDPTGQEFRSSGRNFMSYANDACAVEFSEEQVAFMRVHTLAVKSQFIFSGTLPDHEEEPIELVFPRAEEEVHFENIRFTWRKHPNANAYRVQVARNVGLVLIDADEIVTDTFFVLNAALNPDRNYFWRVTPISDTDFCAPPSVTNRFRSVVSTSTVDIAGNSFRVFPSLLSVNQQITIEARMLKMMDLQTEIVDLGGKIYHSQRWQHQVGEIRQNIPTSNLKPGMYFLKISTGEGLHTFKFIVH